MTLHYHGGPFTPLDALYKMSGRCLCVSFGHPQGVDRMKEIAQVLMKDNGAFKFFGADKKAGREPTDRDWTPYYAWVERHHRPGDWAVIPDVIDGGSQLQDALLRDWPFGHMGAPVWHMDEPIHRLLRLCDEWPRVCVGSTAEYWQIGSALWHHRMVETFNEIMTGRRFVPNIHMLRGMSLSGDIYPFASVDSTDIAQNHNRPHNSVRAMADRWDAINCPATWSARPLQQELAAS